MRQIVVVALVLGCCSSLLAQEPLRAGGDIRAPKQTRNVYPVYPEQALAAGRQAFLVLEAIIDTNGKISQLKALHGPADFVNSATDAIRQWRYSPTELNGQPVPVVFTITMAFFISHKPRGSVLPHALGDSNRSVQLQALGWLLNGVRHSRLELEASELEAAERLASEAEDVEVRAAASALLAAIKGQ